MNVWKPVALAAFSLIFLAFIPVGVVSAQVQVTSADPSSTVQGTVSLDVTINGNGFDSTAAVTFLVTGTTDTGGITVRKVSVRGSKKLVATIDVADTATVNKFDIVVTLDDGRKGKGTTLFAVLLKSNSDPCAVFGLDFPAFTYWQQSGKEQQIYVADSTGKCSRPVYKTSNNIGTVGAGAFSYPVAGTTNVGRIVWPDGNAIYALDFTVTGTSIVVGSKWRVYDGFLLSLDLSKDGNTLYIGGHDESGVYPAIKALTIDTNSTAVAYVGTVVGSSFQGIAVAADGTALFADLSLPASTGHQLIRFTLPCIGSCANVIAFNAAPMDPAASFTAPVLAYSDYLLGYSNCAQLRYLDVSGPDPAAVFAGGQPRYGTRSSWYGGQVLTNGRKPPDGAGRCAAMDMVTQVDPSTGAETQLVRGYDPDGR